jgi:hypothetical protein
MLSQSSRSSWVNWLVVSLFVLGVSLITLYTHHKVSMMRIQYSSDFPNMVVDVMNSAAK